MPRMIDLIRQSAAPAAIMRSAARGALAVPAVEMLEILVYLTTNRVFAEQARMSLAGFDERAAITALKDSAVPREVLDYFLKAENWRPALVPALLENPSVPEPALLEMAQNGSSKLLAQMLASKRVMSSPTIVRELMMNPQLTPAQVGVLEQALGTDGNANKATTTDSAEPEGPSQYEIEHAAEIAAEEGKPFALYSGGADQESTEQSETEGSESASDGSIEPERVSVFQKIAKLSVGERVQLAMRGTKDERFILVRDGARVVAQAVLESPKVSEQEIETFAALKNVQEGVLRGIAGKRKFMKNYAVVRNLTSNPRCPVDVSLPLLTHLLVKDLRNLSVNKNVADTIRKMAFKLWKQKTESNKR